MVSENFYDITMNVFWGRVILIIGDFSMFSFYDMSIFDITVYLIIVLKTLFCKLLYIT